MFGAQRRFFNPTIPVDEQMFYELVRDKESNALIDGYRQSGDAELKRKLPAFIFQATFDETPSKKGKLGAWRKQAATRLTGLVVLDIDHVEKPRIMIEGWMSNIDFDKWGILLVYITPSGKGIKVVFKARMEWGNLADNQIEMAKLLGVQADESGKDASRMAFVCKEEDILFINQELFTYENKEFAEKYNDQYRNGNSNPTHPAPVAHQEVRQVPAENRSLAAEQVAELMDNGKLRMENEELPHIIWRGYNLQEIINQRFANKLPCKEDSNRHKESLKLASDLLVMLDGDKAETLTVLKAQSWVQEIIHERNENVEATVNDAASNLSDREKKSLSPSPSKEMQAAIETVTGKSYRDIIATPSTENDSSFSIIHSQFSIEEKLWLWGKEIEALFEHFPLLKDVTKGLKPNQFTAALFVAGSLLMTLMTRCTYRFYHRPEELRRLNSSVIIEGDPACGKSFATRLFKLLSKPIVEADKEGKKAINAYRELMKTKGANKEKPNKPKVVVRIHPARTSNAQFIQDMVNSVEVVDGEEMQLHMLTFDTELDNTLNIQKGGSWIDKISLELKAFHNEEDGQAYSNVDSVMQDFIVTWNYIYTGTPLALKKKVNERNFGSGLATRLTCIPLPSTNFEMLTRETTVDYESDERLKEWAYKLDKTKGELSLQKIIDALFEWTERRMADAAYNESKADEMLLKRCAYHGVNFAAPFIMMRHWNELKKDGDFWCGEFETDETDWRLVELIVNIQYACQKHYFGALAEKYFDDKLRDAAVNRQRQQKTVDAFNRLSEEFTIDDVMRCFALSGSAARTRVVRLVKDGLAQKVGDVIINGHQQTLYNKTGATMVS